MLRQTLVVGGEVAETELLASQHVFEIVVGDVREREKRGVDRRSECCAADQVAIS